MMMIEMLIMEMMQMILMTMERGIMDCLYRFWILEGAVVDKNAACNIARLGLKIMMMIRML
eukprot:1695045-Karenia_brevis.AAC.2